MTPLRNLLPILEFRIKDINWAFPNMSVEQITIIGFGLGQLSIDVRPERKLGMQLWSQTVCFTAKPWSRVYVVGVVPLRRASKK